MNKVKEIAVSKGAWVFYALLVAGLVTFYLRQGYHVETTETPTGTTITIYEDETNY